MRALHNWMLERQEETRMKTSAAMKPHNGAIIHYVESMRLFAAGAARTYNTLSTALVLFTFPHPPRPE